MIKTFTTLSLSNIIFVVSSYLTNIIIGKQLGPEYYGLYGVIISTMTAIHIIQVSGLPQSTTKFIASSKYNNNEILKASLSIQIVTTLLLTFILFILSTPIAKILNDLSLAPYIKITSLILPFYALFALYISYYSGLHDFKKQALMNIIYSISKAVSVIGLVYVFQLYGAIIGFIISPIIALLFGFHWPKTGKVTPGLYKLLILFSLPLIGYAILSTLQLSIDLFFVKALSANKLDTGLYTASQNIARIPYFALSSFAVILFPVVTKSIHSESLEETIIKIRNILRNLFLFLIPGTIQISLTSKNLLSILYSSEYSPASSSLSYLVVGLAFLTLLNALTYILVASDRPTSTMILSGLGVLITGFLSYILIPTHGLVGAALATTVGAIVTTVIAWKLISSRFSNFLPWESILKISIGGVFIYICFIFIGSYFTTFITLPVLYIILSLVYFSILYLLKEINKSDLQTIKILWPNKKQ